MLGNGRGPGGMERWQELLLREGWEAGVEALRDAVARARREERDARRWALVEVLVLRGWRDLLFGEVWQARSGFQEALRLVRPRVRRDPQRWKGMLAAVLDGLSWLEMEEGEWRRAVRHIEEVLRYFPEPSRLAGKFHHRRALVLFRAGKFEEAHRAAVRAVVMRRRLASRDGRSRAYAQSLLLYALIQNARGDTVAADRGIARALRLYRRWWRETPSPDHGLDLAAALMERAEMDLQRRRWVRALRSTGEALRVLRSLDGGRATVLPDLLHAYGIRARIYELRGDWTRAQRTLEEALRLIEDRTIPEAEGLWAQYRTLLQTTGRRPGRSFRRR